MVLHEECLAEMERRRKASTQKASALSENIAAVPQTNCSRKIDTTEKGIVGFLIRRGIASSTAQANMILVGVMVLVLGPIVWINWPFSKTPSITPAPKGPGTQRT